MANAPLVWDEEGKRLFETGVDHVALYPFQLATNDYSLGVAWNGVTKISNKASGAQEQKKYADNIKYLSLYSAEEFGVTIEAYSSPAEFDACDGTAEPAKGVLVGGQARSKFGLCYRTLIGNDVQNQDYGYKLHLVWNAMAQPAQRDYQTINENPDAQTLSWEITTTPLVVTGMKPIAHITIDSTKADAIKLKALEKILFGSTEAKAKLPKPEEVLIMMK